MAVKGKQIKFIPASGLDQRWKGDIGFADDIVNGRVDPEGFGWKFDRAPEAWWKFPDSYNITGAAITLEQYLNSTIDSCYVWSKQKTEQIYYLIEQGGQLHYFWGNKNTGDFYHDLVILDEKRHVPSVNEAGTQYIPYGNRLLILNGYDQPIWFYGRGKTRPFSFTLPTPSPEVLDIQTGYLAGDELSTGIASPNFAENSHYGLGQVDERNHFNYKMTYIMDTGSESPLSSASPLDWINGSDASEEQKFGGYIAELPIGPDGCVARRIYRTKNQKNINIAGANDSIYYFVNQLNDNTATSYVDISPDGNLVDEAPSGNSSVGISGAYAYGAAWNGRIWLAGGTPHPTKIIYSEAGLPEQFGGFNYFELGNSVGGAITGLHAYYNNLIVFRQRGIDIIRVSSGAFTISSLSSDVGTEATNSIATVPNLGVLFLGNDGIYSLTGGLDGGSSIKISKISQRLVKEIERINFSAAARACAVYSHKEKEYWLHYPVDGQNFNSRGAVFHTLNGQFSLRHALLTEDIDKFKFASMTVDPSGYIILGPKPSWTSNSYTPGSVATLPSTLHVWAGDDFWGSSLTVNSYNGITANYTRTGGSHPGTRWESNWIDFGDNSDKNRVFHVEAEIISYGNLELELFWAQDYDYEFISAGLQTQNRPETYKTSSEDPVFGPVNAQVAKNYFSPGKRLQDARITRIRWDVNTKLVSNFKFRLEPQNPGEPFHLVTFHLYSDSREHKALNSRVRAGRGQPI